MRITPPLKIRKYTAGFALLAFRTPAIPTRDGNFEGQDFHFSNGFHAPVGIRPVGRMAQQHDHTGIGIIAMKTLDSSGPKTGNRGGIQTISRATGLGAEGPLESRDIGLTRVGTPAVEYVKLFRNASANTGMLCQKTVQRGGPTFLHTDDEKINKCFIHNKYFIHVAKICMPGHDRQDNRVTVPMIIRKIPDFGATRLSFLGVDGHNAARKIALHSVKIQPSVREGNTQP